MKIEKIKTIKKYKSFHNYSWHPFFNIEEFHPKTNILYGENGSGKTAICNILKSVSEYKDFVRYFPEEVELQIDGAQYKYSNNDWTSRTPKNSILFFDREFVYGNVHLGNDRGTQQGEQEQESGKLIIEFDKEAINLRAIRDKLARAKEEKNKKLEEYQGDNRTALAFELPDEEESLFRKYRKVGKKAIAKSRGVLEKQQVDLKNRIKNDRKLQQKAKEIQNIVGLESVCVDLSFSPQATYQGVFNFNLTEQTRIEAQAGLIAKIKEHKEFFEEGFEIRKAHPKQCPFCQSKSKEEEIKKIVDVYNRLYDDSYKRQRAIFEKNKQVLIEELEEIQRVYKGFNLDRVFITLKKLADQYSIKNLYIVKEEEKYRKKIHTEKIDELKKRIINLRKPNKKDIAPLYKEARAEFDAILKFFSGISSFVKKKNRLIQLFKKEHTDKKLLRRISKNQTKLERIKTELDFVLSSKIADQKLKLEKLKEERKLQHSLSKAKTHFKSAREGYERYCSTGIFVKTLKKIESYFSHFNFSFKLQLATANRRTESTTELPFAFRVLDPGGNERDLKEGLSEGEIQVLSLCFFFAFLDIQSGKNQKILVFDDPITSLDDSNLSSLVDLIAEEREKFSQTFVLTHHRTFFKFLRKKFNSRKKPDPRCHEYNMLRNKSCFGGSFICKSKKERFLKKLKNFELHLQQIAKNPSGFDVELKIVEYGQYLRYATEHFIKCRLLHWDESNEFPKVVEGIKENKKVSDDDLDKIKQIYSFCNWTTSHVDVGDDHGMAQLKEKIFDFVTIYDRY